MPLQFSPQQPMHHFGASTSVSSGQGSKLSDRQIEFLRSATASCPILVNDDDRMSRMLCRTIFERIGLQVVDTWSPLDAIHICQTQPVSVIISDIMKPEMDGFQMLEHLRSDPRTSHIPVIFVTATSGTREMAFMAGADGYLLKPFHPNEILAEIWRLLSKTIKY